jgi:hypothetical protein
MALSALVTLSLSANVTNALTIGSSTANLSNSYGAALTDGAGAGQANRVYWAQRTLTVSATETLDLAGTLLDQFGVAITFARIKAFAISAAAVNTNNVVVGGGATTHTGLLGATTYTAVVRPGATLAWLAGVADATGYAVTAGTGDLIQIANSSSGTPVTYDVIILGSAT